MRAFGRKWQRVNDALQRHRSDLALAVSRMKELKRRHDEGEEAAPSHAGLRELRHELAGLRKLAARLDGDVAAAERGLLRGASREKPVVGRKKKSAR